MPAISGAHLDLQPKDQIERGGWQVSPVVWGACVRQRGCAVLVPVCCLCHGVRVLHAREWWCGRWGRCKALRWPFSFPLRACAIISHSFAGTRPANLHSTMWAHTRAGLHCPCPSARLPQRNARSCHAHTPAYLHSIRTLTYTHTHAQACAALSLHTPAQPPQGVWAGPSWLPQPSWQRHRG